MTSYVAYFYFLCMNLWKKTHTQLLGVLGKHCVEKVRVNFDCIRNYIEHSCKSKLGSFNQSSFIETSFTKSLHSLKQSFSNQENIPFLYQRSNFVRVFYITNQQTYRNLEVFMCNKLDETSIINPNSFRDFVALEFLGTSHVTSSVLEFIKLNLPLNHKMRSQTYHIHCVIFIRGASK